MKPIVTLTVNPAIDASCVADEVVPMRKVRTRDERYDPGGGGLNVARVIHELGGEAVAFYMAGGYTGMALEGLIERSGITAVRVPIAGLTRVSHTVYETSTGHEFRFTPEGPEVSEAEWRHCLEVLSVIDGEYFVVSGSLARGMPVDFYGRIAHVVKQRGGKLVLDTSGAPLHWALEEGVWLVKPSKRELEHLMGRKAPTPEEEEALAREVVASGRAEIVALTLGSAGAVLANHKGTFRLASPRVETRSAVGAGDSFVGAVVWALTHGRQLPEAFAYGVAAGAASAMTPGTELCRRADVERLYEVVRAQLPYQEAISI
ncbi:1-phosphofructokinase family hexose kinase [Benzoatithermus flavus]|uniref:Phosphofructokinase n=1 Tax=Benzoatithermus flavus TaxID=3108223 RepID=A0ABU8XL45_9PROT